MKTIGAVRAPLQAHDLFSAVNALHERVGTAGRERYERWATRIARRTFLPSALNLAEYLVFRESDLRDVQSRLVPLGLSSLERCEAHVLPSIRAVRATLGLLCGDVDAAADRPTARDFALGARLLERNTRAVFGIDRHHRPRIMVTLGSEAADNPDYVGRLLAAGMDCARINCAHDDADVWEQIAHHVRTMSRRMQRSCSIYMDVAGPKMRTGDHTHDPTLPNCERIVSDKGLNFLETPLDIPSLTQKDHADLDAIAALADIVGQSFVRTAADVELLQEELRARGPLLPIIAKIETAMGIHNLPEILVAGAGQGPFGVMIARGDLAVEIGYLRLAEIQEELLWLCEAAHVPVVWATQVLDRVVRKGLPPRSEMTDAAMAERAECVMLNKGPFVTEATLMLADALARMQGHQAKKSAQLRALHSWSVN